MFPPLYLRRRYILALIAALLVFGVLVQKYIVPRIHKSQTGYELPADLVGRVSIEKVKSLELIVGEPVVSSEDYNKKREFVHALSEIAPTLWKVRKTYYRDIPQQEFEEKILGFVAQLDPHSSYESQSEVLEALKKLKETGGGPVPDLLENPKPVLKIIPSVEAGHYGVLRIVDFNDLDGKGFATQLSDACDAIWASAADGRVDGVVIDLRGNRGGYRNNAIVLVSAFMPKVGEHILTEKSYNTAGKQKVERVLSVPDPLGMNFGRLRGLPVLILVDARSASCSEIVAGVLQQFRIGVVASQDVHTFGKGVVQTESLVSGGKLGRLLLTTHEYFIGHDYRVHGYGIYPDIHLTGGEEGNLVFEEDLENPIRPTGAAPRFVPMKERNPALDKSAREILKALKMGYK
ncbi:MAG TPA: S41 family peptidase [Candidatus Paceibacterota bacterium]|nr:S41 family peptidase [Candidatus Paceibacterota bacterium]